MENESRGNYNGVVEGQSTSRPPWFDGKNYPIWRDRMEIFLTSTDLALWSIIVDGEEPFYKVEDGVKVPIGIKDFTPEDKKRFELYAKAKNTLHCAINSKDLAKMSRCKTAKEMWDKLEFIHVGTSQVKQSKIDQHVHEYELFQMKQGEGIEEMFERFSTIINNLDALGKSYNEGDIVRKVLKSLTPEWESKVNAIQEAHDTNKMTVDQLRGNLITYETTHLSKIRRGDDRKKISLKATIFSRKGVKPARFEEEDDSEESSSSEDEKEFWTSCEKVP